MRVLVRSYGLVRRPAEEFHLPDGLSVAELLRWIGVESTREVAVFLDGERVDGPTRVHDGADARIVVLAPPLSGG